MNIKKIAASLLAAAMLCSGAVYSVSSADDISASESNATAPQNVRVEDGFLVWDEVEDAYGYTVSTTESDGNEIGAVYYKPPVELNRFFFEQQMDFGEHDFKVCIFDESNNFGEYSEPVTASYVSNFEAPTNIRLDGTTIVWDEVSGAARYNFRIYNDGDNSAYRVFGSLYNNQFFDTTSNWIVESGDYMVSFQAMDKDYNVSEWTEPVSYSYTVPDSLEAPQNVYLDESKDNLLWDAVDGATAYNIYIWTSFTDDFGSSKGSANGTLVEDTCLKDWKSYVCPFADIERDITVEAVNGSISSPWTTINVDFEMERDESIDLPQNIVFENDTLRWDGNIIDGAKYWVRMPYNSYVDTEYKIFDSSSPCIDIGDNEFPAGDHEVELYVVDQNYNYNSKIYSFTSEAVQDKSVWIPELFYKFDNLLWDYDRLRHEDTSFFWLRLKQDDTDVKLIKSYSDVYYGLSQLNDGDYSIEICVYERNTDKLGPWSKPLVIKKHGEGLFDKKNETTTEVEIPPEAADVPEEDRITSVTINPAFNMKHKDGDDVELDLSKIKIKAKEIYDEEGLKRASEALGETISGNKHYNLLDLTLLYNEEDFSNGYDGLVQVIIPIPAGHRDKTFSCYRLTEVDGKMTKEIIPGEQTEDSYIIYLEHFSEYAIVADGGETGDDETGDSETGDSETGDSETGDSETGDSETGDGETGDDETGDNETGNNETGDSETGGGNNSGNPSTGIALSVLPLALAASAVIVIKKRK